MRQTDKVESTLELRQAIVKMCNIKPTTASQMYMKVKGATNCNIHYHIKEMIKEKALELCPPEGIDQQRGFKYIALVKVYNYAVKDYSNHVDRPKETIPKGGRIIRLTETTNWTPREKVRQKVNIGSTFGMI